MNILEESIWQS